METDNDEVLSTVEVNLFETFAPLKVQNLLILPQYTTDEMNNLVGEVGSFILNTTNNSLYTYNNGWNIVVSYNVLIGSGETGYSGQGYACALYEDTLVVGGQYQNSNVGATWVFIRDTNGNWFQQAGPLVGSGHVGNSQQGVAVAIYGDTLVTVGSYDNNIVGAVWVFTRSEGVWTQQGSKLVPNDYTGHPGLGVSGVNALSIYEDTIVVGGPDDDSGTGATWVFVRNAGVWTQQGSKLIGNDYSIRPQQGFCVAVYGDTLITTGAFDNGGMGATWIYKRSGTTWSQLGTKLVYNSMTTQAFSLAFYGNMFAIGSCISIGSGLYQMYVLIHEYINGSWTFTGSILYDTNFFYYNQPLSLYNGVLAIGDPDYLDQTIQNAGATLVYSRINNVWTQIKVCQYLPVFEFATQGWCASIYGNTVVSGLPNLTSDLDTDGNAVFTI